jgi:hypothetical protein
MKTDGQLGHCHLKGREGDAANVVLTAIGHNLRLILAWLRTSIAPRSCSPCAKHSPSRRRSNGLLNRRRNNEDDIYARATNQQRAPAAIRQVKRHRRKLCDSACLCILLSI